MQHPMGYPMGYPMGGEAVWRPEAVLLEGVWGGGASPQCKAFWFTPLCIKQDAYPWVYPWVHIFEVPWPPSGPPENTAPSKLWARARSRNAFHARDGRRSRGTLCGGMILCRIVWMCVGSLKDLSAIIATQCCKHGSRNMNRYQNTARATCLRY